MVVIAFIVTVVIGVFAEVTIGTSWNMHGIGGITSIAVMGAFILWSIRRKK